MLTMNAVWLYIYQTVQVMELVVIDNIMCIYTINL